jgi:hypothetical protein
MEKADYMRQMAGDDTALQETLQTPTPASQDTAHQNPALNNLGLNEFAKHMTTNAFNTFISVIHWSVLCQNLLERKPIEWTDEAYAAMQAPFVGFGNAYLWEATYSNNLAKIIHAEYFSWHLMGRGYQVQNRLPELLIKKIAPILANTSQGWEHARSVADLISDPRTYQQF